MRKPYREANQCVKNMREHFEVIPTLRPCPVELPTCAGRIRQLTSEWSSKI